VSPAAPISAGFETRHLAKSRNYARKTMAIKIATKARDLDYPEMMIRIATFSDLLEHCHGLGLYCGECERWGSADLHRLVRSGRGARQVRDARFRCRDCGSLVEKQVQPPVPALGSAVQYIQCTDSG